MLMFRSMKLSTSIENRLRGPMKFHNNSSIILIRASFLTKKSALMQYIDWWSSMKFLIKSFFVLILMLCKAQNYSQHNEKSVLCTKASSKKFIVMFKHFLLNYLLLTLVKLSSINWGNLMRYFVIIFLPFLFSTKNLSRLMKVDEVSN